MKKLMVVITEQQNTFFAGEAERLQVSKNELIRRALDWFMHSYPKVPEWLNDELRDLYRLRNVENKAGAETSD